MARNMYGATSADFTITSGGRVIPGAVLTLWTARTGGAQITDLLDRDSVACTTVTSAADGSVVYYGPNDDKTVHWADSGQGSRVAIRPVNLTGEPPTLTVGTVTTGTADVTISGTSPDYDIDFVLPPVGTNGVNTAAIQDGAVTPAKLATTGRFTFPTGAANGYGFTGGAVHLSGTGVPESVITAAPGSTWLQTDSTTDVKGWIRWVKASGTGSTGWVAGAEADTGWRNVSASLINSWAGSLYIRRVGATVYVKVEALDPAAKTSNNYYSLPTGFRVTAPNVRYALYQQADMTWRRGDVDSGTPQLSVVGGASPMYGNITYAATSTWPSSLPGTAA